MPTYQYNCTDCGEPLEAVQSFSEDALTECPACGGRLRKVFSAVGIVFKGSGFYRNDSRSSDNAKKAGSTSEGKAESKADSAANSSNGDNAKSSSTSESSKTSDSGSSASPAKKEPASTK